MLPSEVEALGYDVERPLQGDCGTENAIGEVVAVMVRYLTQDLCPDDAIGVVVPAIEQHAPEALGRLQSARGRVVLEQPGYRAGVVDHGRLRVGKHHVRVLVECVDAAPE